MHPFATKDTVLAKKCGDFSCVALLAVGDEPHSWIGGGGGSRQPIEPLD